MTGSKTRLAELQDHEPSLDEFRSGVIDGLSAPRKFISSKFLYDARGSRLFDDICELPEYYPTRVETALLERHG